MQYRISTAVSFAALLAAFSAGAAPQPIEPPLVGRPGVPSRRVEAVRPGALRPSPVDSDELKRISSKEAVDRIRADVARQTREIREFSRKLAGTTEDSLTNGGALRDEMVSAGADQALVDEIVAKLKDAAPAMREAGRQVSRELDRQDREASGK